jgi:hypothetical protein
MSRSGVGHALDDDAGLGAGEVHLQWRFDAGAKEARGSGVQGFELGVVIRVVGVDGDFVVPIGGHCGSFLVRVV